MDHNQEFMSGHQRKLMEKARRDRLKDEGLCTDCGERQADLNKDGTKGFRCRPCSDNLAGKRKYERAANAPAPVRINRDWFEVGVESYLDSEAFKLYCERVYAAILKLAKPRNGEFPAIRQIKEAVGENHPLNSLMIDALDALMGEGKISKVGGVLISRYKPTLMPVRKATGIKEFRLAGSHVPRPRQEAI